MGFFDSALRSRLRLPRIRDLSIAQDLHQVATAYPSKAPSDYYGLSGLEALLFNRAVLWAARELDQREAALQKGHHG